MQGIPSSDIFFDFVSIGALFHFVRVIHVLC